MKAKSLKKKKKIDKNDAIILYNYTRKLYTYICIYLHTYEYVCAVVVFIYVNVYVFVYLVTCINIIYIFAKEKEKPRNIQIQKYKKQTNCGFQWGLFPIVATLNFTPILTVATCRVML